MKRFLLGSLLLTLLSAGPGEVRASRPNPGKEDSPTGYEIRVKLHNYPDSLNHFLRLGRYYWSGRYLVDTAVYHPENETYVFSGPESMEGGMYLLITGDDRYAEFVFDQNQHIGIETTYPQLFSSIRFEDSPENDLFVNFSKNGQADFEKVDELRKQLDAAKQAQDEAKAGKIQPIKAAVKTGEKIAETGHKTKVMLKDGLQTGGIDKEIYIAVIAMALKQYEDNVHDIESNIITIKPHHTNWNIYQEETIIP